MAQAEIEVQYFAAARDLSGVAQETVGLPSAALSCRELLRLLGERHPRLAPFLSRMRLAVNDEIVSAEAGVSAGDHVAVLPPVAGGSGGGMAHAGLRQTKLSIDEAVALVSHPSAGGITLFVGVVRDHADGNEVARLDYEAHATLAHKQLVQITEQVAGAHEGVRVCALHRVGSLVVGDLAVVVAASAAHREQAFVACRETIERIKAEVAVWKKEWDPQGAAHWVNLDGNP